MLNIVKMYLESSYDLLSDMLLTLVTHLQTAEYQAWRCHLELCKFTEETNISDLGLNVHLVLHSIVNCKV